MNRLALSLGCLGFLAALAQTPAAAAQTVVVTGAASLAPVPAAPSAPAAQPAPAPSGGAAALGAAQPCVMVLPNGQQVQCPVVVVQADQAPQPVPPPPAAAPTPAPTPTVAAQAYAQPYQAYRPRMRRHRLRYRPGMDVPAGAELIRRRRLGLLIPGIAIFGAHYLSIVIVGTSEDSGIDATNYIPVIGPLLTLDNADYQAGRTIRIYDSLAQAVGLGLFLAGMRTRTYVQWVGDSGQRRQLAFAPGFGPNGGSVNAQLRF